jgi:hypothetical protein
MNDFEMAKARVPASVSRAMYDADTSQGRGSHRWSLAMVPMNLSRSANYVWSQRTGDVEYQTPQALAETSKDAANQIFMDQPVV